MSRLHESPHDATLTIPGAAGAVHAIWPAEVVL